MFFCDYRGMLLKGKNMIDKKPFFGRGQENVMKKVDINKRLAEYGVDPRSGVDF